MPATSPTWPIRCRDAQSRSANYCFVCRNVVARLDDDASCALLGSLAAAEFRQTSIVRFFELLSGPNDEESVAEMISRFRHSSYLCWIWRTTRSAIKQTVQSTQMPFAFDYREERRGKRRFRHVTYLKVSQRKHIAHSQVQPVGHSFQQGKGGKVPSQLRMMSS